VESSAERWSGNVKKVNKVATSPKSQIRGLEVSTLQDRLAVCRLLPGDPVPKWAWSGALASVTRTRDELSIVCAEDGVPEGVSCERGWRCLSVQGPIAFSEVGVLASLLTPLAEAGISVFAVSTYETDYLLVKQDALSRAQEALASWGHVVHRSPGGGGPPFRGRRRPTTARVSAAPQRQR
jgi:hypothetical protein